MAKLSGPRMRTGSYYSKGKPRGRPRKKVYKKKSGLNKTEKKQVKAIINRQAESKYFNVTPISQLKGSGDAGVEMILARAGYPQMRVLGFQTGNGLQTDNTAIQYGISDITALNLARTFAAGDANGYDVEGSYVTPSLALSTFNIQRLYLDTTNGSDQALECTPYLVRMLRLSPRPKKSTYQTIVPNEDAFLDQFSQEIGIKDTNFGHYEIQMLKPNTKKYQVIQDSTWIMKPPCSFNELDIGDGTWQTSSVNDGSRRQMNFKHNIGNRLFYDAPTEVSDPTDGFKVEYILFHVVALGTANAASISPDTVRFGVKSVSTFKDL